MNQEAKTAAFFQAHGFLVKRDLKIAIESTPVDATDIDVFAIRFTEPFNEEKIVIDCKDKRKPRPFERILWTAGLKNACGATRAIVVLPQAPWQAFSFGQKQQIELLKEESIDQFLNVESYQPYGDALQDTAENEQLFRSQLLESDKDLIRDNHRLRSMLLSGHPLTNFNAIINILSRLNNKYSRNSFAFSWYYRMVCFNGAVVASVMLLRFIAEVKWLEEKDWRDYARKKFTYGDMPVQKAVSLARTAFGQEFFDGLPEPHYCAEALDLIESIMSQRAMSKLPTLIDRFLFGHILVGLDVQNQFEKTDYKAIKQFLSVLSYASGLAANFWSQPLKQMPTNNAPRTTPYNPKKQYSKKAQQDQKRNQIEASETKSLSTSTMMDVAKENLEPQPLIKEEKIGTDHNEIHSSSEVTETVPDQHIEQEGIQQNQSSEVLPGGKTIHDSTTSKHNETDIEDVTKLEGSTFNESTHQEDRTSSEKENVIEMSEPNAQEAETASGQISLAITKQP